MKNNPLKALTFGEESYAILPHINPDGDAIGSSLALYRYLKQKTERVWIVLDDPIPFNLEFLNVPTIALKDFQSLEVKLDRLFCMDSSDLTRLGDREVLRSCSKQVVNIDHHKTNLMYGDINVVDAEASSTGEIVYKLIADVETDVTEEIATPVYVALSTDTGSFKYSNTSAETMQIAGILIQAGIDLNKINTELYQNKPLDKILVLKKAMEHMRLEDEGRLAMSWITQADCADMGIQNLDTDGVSEFFRDIHGVEVVILLKEKTPNVFKASLRSKYEFDVAALCLEFGGGGHAKAAGCTVEGTIAEAIASLLKTYYEMRS